METNIFNYSALWHRLLPVYAASEAQAVIRLVLEDLYGFTLTDLAMGSVEALPVKEQQHLDAIIARLRRGEPVQYILGKARFCGRNFHVTPAVLIPRPETEELCQIIIENTNKPLPPNTQHLSPEYTQHPTPQILDIGTGSGCIAITLALDLPDAEVTAIDVSAPALKIASENADRLHAELNFLRQDILKVDLEDTDDNPKASAHWDIIVSNPPYIAEKEKSDMEANVLDYEPGLALFVPDDDPLRFYRAIANYAVRTLCNKGRLYFEINPLYAEPLQRMLSQKGFTDIKIINDQFGKQRFITCNKYQNDI